MNLLPKWDQVLGLTTYKFFYGALTIEEKQTLFEFDNGMVCLIAFLA